MVNDVNETLVNDIAARLFELISPPPARMLLYSEVADMTASLAIFIDKGNHLSYYQAEDPHEDSALYHALQDLWYDTPPDERWAEIEMFVQDGRFDATFNYKDDIDPDEDEFVRRDRIVAKYFGGLPILYPPLKDYSGYNFDL